MFQLLSPAKEYIQLYSVCGLIHWLGQSRRDCIFSPGLISQLEIQPFTMSLRKMLHIQQNRQDFHIEKRPLQKQFWTCAVGCAGQGFLSVLEWQSEGEVAISHLKPAAIELAVPQTAALSRAFCLKTVTTQSRLQPTLVQKSVLYTLLWPRAVSLKG